MSALTLEPIGIVRSPFHDRMSAPRQPAAAEGVAGTIELFPGRNYEHALEDLEGWEYVWVIFWFHRNEGWRPKVLPPRSTRRRGVLSTRSPHRPNPIGLSVVKLERLEGLALHIRNIDMLDGTPVLDIKPYVPYTDAIPAARTGWLGPLPTLPDGSTPKDPEPGFHVTWSELAHEQALWLEMTHEVNLTEPVTRTLTLGPQPHPYRRIKREADGSLRLSFKDWRIHFRLEERAVSIVLITTGYREAALAKNDDDPALVVHRAFVARFGAPSTPASVAASLARPRS